MGQAARPTTTTSAAAARAGRRRRAMAAVTSKTAVGVTRCSRRSTGPAEKVSAAHNTTDSAGAARSATPAPAVIDACANSAAIRPTVCATPAAGTATRLAGTEVSGRPSSQPSSTGAAPAWAPRVTAAARRSGRGPGRRSASHGAATSTPAVASKLSAKPTCPASIGSANSSSSTAIASTWRGSRPLPSIPAPSTRPAMAPARSTDGCQRTSKAYQTTAAIAICRRPRAPTPRRALNPSTPASISATWRPETTTRWVRLAAANWSARSGERPCVSPIVRPASNAARSVSRWRANARRVRSRTVLVAASNRPGGPASSIRWGSTATAACSRRR